MAARSIIAEAFPSRSAPLRETLPGPVGARSKTRATTVIFQTPSSPKIPLPRDPICGAISPCQLSEITLSGKLMAALASCLAITGISWALRRFLLIPVSGPSLRMAGPLPRTHCSRAAPRLMQASQHRLPPINATTAGMVSWTSEHLSSMAFAPVLVVGSAVSRQIHGERGPFDIPLPLSGSGGVECRATGGNFQVIIAFSYPVSVGSVSITSADGRAAAQVSISGKLVTLDLSQVANGQTLGIFLNQVDDSYAHRRRLSSLPCPGRRQRWQRLRLCGRRGADQSAGQPRHLEQYLPFGF